MEILNTHLSPQFMKEREWKIFSTNTIVLILGIISSSSLGFTFNLDVRMSLVSSNPSDLGLGFNWILGISDNVVQWQLHVALLNCFHVP